MDFNLDSLLNLPNVTVFSYSTKLEFIILNLHLINEGITCPHCNNYTALIHQTRTKLVRDLSIFGRLVYLKVPRRQFYCGECKKSPTESLTWLNHHQRQTNRYQEYIYERVKELTVEQVSKNESIGRDAVQGIFHKVAQLKKKTGECLNA
jgi:transposase